MADSAAVLPPTTTVALTLYDVPAGEGNVFASNAGAVAVPVASVHTFTVSKSYGEAGGLTVLS